MDDRNQAVVTSSSQLVPALALRICSEIYPKEIDMVGCFCPNPKCLCRDTALYFYEADSDFKKRLFKMVLNYETWKLVSTEVFDHNNDCPEIINEFMESLNDDMKSTILSGKEKAVAEKRYTLRYDIDYSDIRLDTLVCYSEIYNITPHEAYIFEHNNTQYLVLDHYCPNPKCDCKEALLAFLVVKNNGACDPPVWECWVNFKSGKRTVKKKDSGITSQYSEELYEKFNELLDGKVVESLTERYLRIKKWGEEHLLTRLRDDLQVPVKSQKIGRNAPCPCGSGKKYKKCCGI